MEAFDAAFQLNARGVRHLIGMQQSIIGKLFAYLTVLDKKAKNRGDEKSKLHIGSDTACLFRFMYL